MFLIKSIFIQFLKMLNYYKIIYQKYNCYTAHYFNPTFAIKQKAKVRLPFVVL